MATMKRHLFSSINLTSYFDFESFFSTRLDLTIWRVASGLRAGLMFDTPGVTLFTWVAPNWTVLYRWGQQSLQHVWVERQWFRMRPPGDPDSQYEYYSIFPTGFSQRGEEKKNFFPERERERGKEKVRKSRKRHLWFHVVLFQYSTAHCAKPHKLMTHDMAHMIKAAV